MPLLAAHELDLDSGSVQVYNAMDSMLTAEILGELKSLLPEANAPPQLLGPKLIYDFERALQAPAMEMMLRGWCVDPWAREAGIAELRRRLSRLSLIIDCYAGAIWDQRSPTKPRNDYPKPKLLNPESESQLKLFFYDCMKLPKVTRHKGGEETFPMDRDALEHLDRYFIARPIVQAILAYRDTAGQLEVMESQVDDDWRLRTSYNPAATTTGRWSSSKSTTGTGRNLQNIEEDLRYWLVADPGAKLLGADLEQAESRETAWLCGVLFDDWSLLDSCESGDPHTVVARIIWPKLAWNGDLAHDRKIAETIYYRHYSHRDMAKRCRHACLTEDHEVLTPSGWVPIGEKPDIILQFSEEKSEFVVVSNWTDSEQEVVFCEWNGSSLSAQMTPDHRILYRNDSKSGLKIATATAVSNMASAKIPSGWGYIGGTVEISVEDARLIAAYQCDGYWNHGSKVEFHLRKPRKIARLENLANAGKREYSQGRSDYDKFYVQIPEISTWPKKAGAYLLTWPEDSVRAYLEELVYWDGHIDKKGCSTLSSTDKDHLEWIQTINRIYGIGGNLVQHSGISGFGSVSYVLAYNGRQFTKSSSLRKTRKFMKARALCPTVPSGFFYIRRNGKISVTGNTEKGGLPPEISKQLRIPVPMIREFQQKYFAEFPAQQKLFTWIASQIQRDRYLINAFGRRRDFFGRPDSHDTLKEAIAFMSQSPTADRLNLGLWRIWRYEPDLALLAQLHDAVYAQRSEVTDEADLIARVQRHLDVPLSFRGRRFTVPSEVKVGWRWANATPAWPDGMIKWKGSDTRTRTQARVAA